MPYFHHVSMLRFETSGDVFREFFRIATKPRMSERCLRMSRIDIPRGLFGSHDKKMSEGMSQDVCREVFSQQRNIVISTMFNGGIVARNQQ